MLANYQAHQKQTALLKDASESLNARTMKVVSIAFLSNSVFQLLPVNAIDKRPVADDVPGPISSQILAAWSELVGVDIVGQALEQAKK